MDLMCFAMTKQTSHVQAMLIRVGSKRYPFVDCVFNPFRGDLLPTIESENEFHTFFAQYNRCHSECNAMECEHAWRHREGSRSGYSVTMSNVLSSAISIER